MLRKSRCHDLSSRASIASMLGEGLSMSLMRGEEDEWIGKLEATRCDANRWRQLDQLFPHVPLLPQVQRASKGHCVARMSTVKENGGASPPTRRKSIIALLKLTLLHRLLTLALLLLFTALQSPFDASSPILSTAQRLLHPSALLRWDSTHYFSQGAAHALDGAPAGYAWEHNAAFQPGLPFVIRAAGRLGLGGEWNAEVAVWASALFCLLTSVACPAVLYL